MAHAAEQECDACDDLKRISREAGAAQWGQKVKAKKPAAISSHALASAASSSNISSFAPSATTSAITKPPATDVHKPIAYTVSSSSSSSAAFTPANDEYYSGGFWELQPAPGLNELGQAGWTLLHTMAAYYPEDADDARQAITHQFLRSFGKVFPCTDCGRDFQRIVTENPPRLKRRDEFVLWLCEAHNDVNAQLGKPPFPCSEALYRWRESKAP